MVLIRRVEALQRLAICSAHDRSKNRGPRVSRLASEPPSPRCAVPGKGACAGPLCLPCPSTVQCFGRGIAGAGRAELSALQLPALCGAGADLQPLRSRQYLLWGRVCADSSARGGSSSRSALSTSPPWSASSCRPAAAVADTSAARSDASGLCQWPRLRQRIGTADIE